MLYELVQLHMNQTCYILLYKHQNATNGLLSSSQHRDLMRLWPRIVTLVLCYESSDAETVVLYSLEFEEKMKHFPAILEQNYLYTSI